MKWKCVQCGKCCQLPNVGSDYWLNAELTEQQKTDLLNAREKYPASEQCCDMLVYESDLGVCLIEKLYGHDMIPTKCQQQPFGHPEIFCHDYKRYVITNIYFDRDDGGLLKIETADGIKRIPDDTLLKSK